MIPFLQELVLKDFWLKLFSFALASLIWFTINIAIKKDISPVASLSLGSSEQMILRDLPISVLVSAEESRRFSVNHKTADVTLQGDPASLKNLRRRDVRVLVDLSEGGLPNDPHRRIEVFTPPGMAKIKIDPEEVQFETTTNK